MAEVPVALAGLIMAEGLSRWSKRHAPGSLLRAWCELHRSGTVAGMLNRKPYLLALAVFPCPLGRIRERC